MAAFHGKHGKVQWDADGTEVGLRHVTGWTCNVSAEITDATGMATTYGAGVTYNIGDVVENAGSYFTSRTDANVGNSTASTTYWITGTWRKKVAGFFVWTATVETILPGTEEIPIAPGGTEALGEDTPAKLELWLNQTTANIDVLYGSAICTGINPVLDKDDVHKVSYEFQGVATLAFGTADPTY